MASIYWEAQMVKIWWTEKNVWAGTGAVWVSFNHFLTIGNESSLSLHQVDSLHLGISAQCSASMWATVDCWFERKKEKQGIDCLGASPGVALLQGVGSGVVACSWERRLQLLLQLQPAATAASCVSSNGYSYFFSAFAAEALVFRWVFKQNKQASLEATLVRN